MTKKFFEELDGINKDMEETFGTKPPNELWAFKNMLFTSEEEMETYVFDNYNFPSYELLHYSMEIYDFQDLLDWCGLNGYRADKIYEDFGIDIGWLLKGD